MAFGGQLQGSTLPLGTPQDEVGPSEATFIRLRQLPASKDLGWSSRSLPRPLQHAQLIASWSAAWLLGHWTLSEKSELLSLPFVPQSSTLNPQQAPSLPASFLSPSPENSVAPWLPGIPHPPPPTLPNCSSCCPVFSAVDWLFFSCLVISHLSENVTRYFS